MNIRNTCKLRFRLITLFAITGLLALVISGIQSWLDSQPIQWLTFTHSTLDQHVDDDRPIVIFVGADWDSTSAFMEKHTFNDRELKRTLRWRSAVVYYADLTPTNTEVKSLLQLVGYYATPMVVVYPCGTSSDPFVFKNATNAKRITESLKTTAK